MFIEYYFLIIIIITYSEILAIKNDEKYLTEYGPYGLITLKKNDSFIEWIRVPEESYKRWILALKLWRTSSIVIGIICLIFAALLLAYIVHSFVINTTHHIGSVGELKSNNDLLYNDINLIPNYQQITFKHELQHRQQGEQDTQILNYDNERHLPVL